MNFSQRHMLFKYFITINNIWRSLSCAVYYNGRQFKTFLKLTKVVLDRWDNITSTQGVHYIDYIPRSCFAGYLGGWCQDPVLIVLVESTIAST